MRDRAVSPLAHASRERGNFGYKDAIFILLDEHPVLSSRAVSKHECTIASGLNAAIIILLQLTSNLLAVDTARSARPS